MIYINWLALWVGTMRDFTLDKNGIGTKVADWFRDQYTWSADPQKEGCLILRKSCTRVEILNYAQ